jgi:predicted outer membrane repeat protein
VYADSNLSGGVVLKDATFTGNRARTANGGGVWLGNEPSATITGTTSFTDNTAADGGGGLFGGTIGAMSITDTVFDGNKAGGSGGGLLILAGSITVDGDAQIKNNDSAGSRVAGGPVVANLGGGGLYYSGSSPIAYMTIAGNTKITNNKTTGSQNMGGGIASNNTQGYGIVIGEDVLIGGNESQSGGGGIAAVNPLSIGDAVIVRDNSANTDGGGIWLPYANLDKLDVAPTVTFSGNTAASAAERIAPLDLPTYTAHVLAPDNSWSVNPATSAPFTRGYNNYDISYSPERFDLGYYLESDGSHVSTQTALAGDLAEAPSVTLEQGSRG